jgi:peptidoglycan hydrolase-like protein with peptidoglycan-binding domain
MKDAQSCATQFTLLSTATRSDGNSTKDDDDSTRNGRNSNSRDINSTRLFTHLKPNKVLIAASKVIEQTECTIRQNDEKIRFLTSIIDTLDAKTAVQTSIRSKNINTSSPGDVSPQVRQQQQQQQPEYYYDYTLSAVYAHAYALRSQIFVEMRQLDDAIKDAQHVVIETADRHTQKHQQHAHSSSSSFTTPLSTTLAYRSWVDAEYLMVMQQQEDNVGTKNTMLSQQTVRGGFSTIFQQQQQLRRLLLRPNIDTSRVRSILQRWMADQPSYRLKIEQELKNLP